MKYKIALIFGLFMALNVQAQEEFIDEAIRYAELGKMNESLAAATKLIASTEEPQAGFYIFKSDIFVAFNEYDLAIKNLTAAIEIMPDSLSLYNTRGVFYDRIGEVEKAIKDFTFAIDNTKDDKYKAHLLANRGGNKSRIMDFEGAYADCKKAVELDPNNLDAYNNLAIACDETGRPDETLIFLEKIIEIDPEYVPGYINLGFKYSLMNEHEKAINYFDKAIRLDNQAALAFSNRAFSKLKTNKVESALFDIIKSIELYPTNSFAFKIKALIHIEKNENKLACKELNTAKELGYEISYGEEVNELLKLHCN